MESTGGTQRSQDQAAYQTFFSFFGLRENPFRANPDPRYLFLTSSIRRALNELTLGSQSGKSLIVLTGEAGTGKTSLVNHLLASLRKQEIPVSFVFNSHLDINNLFEFILSNFGVKFDPRQNSNLRILLNQWLARHFQLGRAPVIILDEAQGLSTAVLEEVRMLLNLEVGGESLVRIVLAGQPELDVKLHRPELRQLRQRIMVRCRTAPLSVEETHGYLQHRLRVAGSPDGSAFSQPAMDAIHFYSGGVPRVMNLICEHALINAYSDGVRPVPPEIVENVAREFRFDDFRPLPQPFGDQPLAEVIPMDSSASRMRMSALLARESAPAQESAADAGLLAELMSPGASPDRSGLPVSPEPAAHRIAAPEISPPDVTVEPSVSAPPARPPAIVNPAPASAPPVRPHIIAAPPPSQGWDMPRPVANMFWSRSAPASPIKLRLQATSARLEASVTQIMQKVDELKALEKLQRLAGSSLQWLRQPMRTANSHRTPVGTRQKH